MKKLQNNFTTPEQSKRLLELGVPEWTADCFYKLDLYSFKTEMCFTKEDNLLYHYTPCWSVGRLMEIIDIFDNEDSSGDFGEEYPSTTKVMRKLNMDYITYLVKSIERATELKLIDFSKLEEDETTK